jgi:ATP-dependent Clp protease, protease subunit
MAGIGTVQVNVESGLKRWPFRQEGQNAEIRIYSDIGFWYTSQMFAEQLDALKDVEVLDIRINSFGGVASEGVAMYQALARHPAKKRVWIDAAAYSAATIPAMAASPGELRIAFNARFMIHNAWNFAEGDKHEMRKVGDILELLDGTIAATYQKRMAGLTKEKILGLMNDETWYDAESAVAAGLADETFDAEEIDLPEDSLNMVREFKRPPAELVERIERARSRKGFERSHVPDDLAAGGDVDARWAVIRNREAA